MPQDEFANMGAAERRFIAEQALAQLLWNRPYFWTEMEPKRLTIDPVARGTALMS